MVGSALVYNAEKQLSHQDNMHYLERKFHRIENGIKLLVRKKAKLLQKIERHRRRNRYNIPPISYHHAYYPSTQCYSYPDDDDDLMEDECYDSPMLELPDEVILHIFSYLGAMDICSSVVRVCSLFRAILLDESLWRPLYHDHWESHAIDHASEVGGFRELFMGQCRTESNWWAGRYSLSTLEGHKGAVRCLQFANDTLVTGSSDKTIRVWELSSGQCVKTLQDTRWVRCLQYDDEHNLLVTTGMDSTQTKVWSIDRGAVVSILEVPRGFITCLQLLSPRLVTGSLDGTVRMWDMTSGRVIGAVSTGHDSLRSLWMKGDLMVSAGTERQLLLWDMRTKTTTTTMTNNTTTRTTMINQASAVIEGASFGNYCVQFDPSSSTVVSGSNGCVAIADLRNPLASPTLLRGHTDVVSCLQFSGRKLVSGSMDHTVRLWDMNKMQCSQVFRGHEHWVWSLQFDPDKIVTASGDEAVKVWDFKNQVNNS